MRFVSVRDLNTKGREIWDRIKKEEIVVTSNGKPVAILSGVTEDTLEKTLQTLRRTRALMALEEMQKKAVASGMDKWTDAQIESEIQAVRKARKR